jgi:hypothetical protein
MGSALRSVAFAAARLAKKGAPTALFMGGAQLIVGATMQVVFLVRPFFTFGFLFQKSVVSTGLLQLARSARYRPCVAQLPFSVLADPADSLGPANGYVATTFNAGAGC